MVKREREREEEEEGALDPVARDHSPSIHS